jgi:hypothetical protein
VTRGTVFEQMKIPLPKVFLAIYLMTDKQGISAMALSKHLDVAYNTAFDLLHKLRLAMADRDRHYTLDGVLQVDEAYVGGHAHLLHLPSVAPAMAMTYDDTAPVVPGNPRWFSVGVRRAVGLLLQR